MASLLAAAAPPSRINTQMLEGKDAIKHAIMTNARMTCTETTNTGEYRGWIMGRFRNKVKDLAIAIKAATEELADIGLLKEIRDAKKKGRKMQFYRKVLWDDLADDARSEAERLIIARDVFE